MKILKKIQKDFPKNYTYNEKEWFYISQLQNITDILNMLSPVKCLSGDDKDSFGNAIFAENKYFIASSSMTDDSYTILIYSTQKHFNPIQKIRIKNFCEELA